MQRVVPLDNTRCERTAETFFVTVCVKMVSNRKAGVLKRERNRGKHSWGSTEPMGSLPRRQLVRAEGDNNRGLHGNSDVIVTSGKRLYGRIKQKDKSTQTNVFACLTLVYCVGRAAHCFNSYLLVLCLCYVTL